MKGPRIAHSEMTKRIYWVKRWNKDNTVSLKEDITDEILALVKSDWFKANYPEVRSR